MKEVDFNVACLYKPYCHLRNDKCEKTCPRYLEMNFLIINCGQPNASKYLKKMTPLTNKEYKAYQELQNIKDNIENYVAEGHNLFITSSTVNKQDNTEKGNVITLTNCDLFDSW